MEKIFVTEERINDKIPILCCQQDTPEKKRVVILFHSYLETKESMLSIAYRLAKLGYFTVLVDNKRHGERPDYEEQFPWKEFYNVVFETAEEIGEIINFVEEKYPVHSEEISVLGISLGGMVSLASAVLHPKISRVATILSGGSFSKLARVKSIGVLKHFFSDNDVEGYQQNLNRVDEMVLKYDPYHNVEKFYPKKVMMVNGTMDMAFPIKIVKEFQDKLTEHYQDKPEHLSFHHIPRAGHNVSRSMINKVIDWFEQ